MAPPRSLKRSCGSSTSDSKSNEAPRPGVLENYFKKLKHSQRNGEPQVQESNVLDHNTQNPNSEVPQAQEPQAQEPIIPDASVPNPNPETPNTQEPNIPTSNVQEVDGIRELVFDPGMRPSIYSLARNGKELENIRMAYLLKGPSQPKNHEFKKTEISGAYYKFSAKWYERFGSWLEYSTSKDAVYCLHCYLFKPDSQKQGGGGTFVTEGFRNWKKIAKKLKDHVGDVNSSHNNCYILGRDLLKSKQHIDHTLAKVSDREANVARLRLITSIRAIRYLCRQGLAFRGHNESKKSGKRGNFLELLNSYGEVSEDVKEVLEKGPENQKYIAPTIQKEIVSAAATLTRNAILEEIGDDFFTLLVDEARDISIKEQMAIVLRFVNKKGCVIERFLGLVHVEDTTAQSLKRAIEFVLGSNGLSISKIRGQGYDGVSNMRGEHNGLKSLILAENKSAFYVHCFAHQLQLTLVGVAKKHDDLRHFFDTLANISNLVSASPKRRDQLRQKQLEQIVEGIGKGKIKKGKGLNQEATIKRPGDTRWGSHYGTIMSVINLFSPMGDVLEFIWREGYTSANKTEAKTLHFVIHQFEFVFLLHLMKDVLAITNHLSMALQKDDQNIVNAISLVTVSRTRLEEMREDGWEKLLKSTCDFCKEHDIAILEMEDVFVVPGRSRRGGRVITNYHRYRVELFNTVIDHQLQELNNRFDKTNVELLLCVASLDPRDSFAAFDKSRLIQFAEFYPSDFTEIERSGLSNELETYIMDVRSDVEFANVKGIGELGELMVAKKKDTVYPLVYSLLKFALLLPVATASVERVFSGMKLIKTPLRNKMGDAWLNDCLVIYVEDEIFRKIANEDIMEYFKKMKNRKPLM